MTHTTVDLPLLPQRHVRVSLLAWGASEEDVDRAIAAARQPWSHRTWEITHVERLTGVPCPLPDFDPRMITKESGYDWAYIAYPDRSA